MSGRVVKRDDDGREVSVEDGAKRGKEQRTDVESLPDEAWHWEVEQPLVDDREFLYADERWSRDD